MKTGESFKVDLTSGFRKSMARGILCLAACALGLGLPASARAATIATFDISGAASTLPLDISIQGLIVGFYADASGVNHGFLRARDDTITTFDAPGADTGSGQGTFAYSINPEKTISGEYIDASGVYHGFVRAPDGSFTKFDVPGAGNGSGQP